MIYFENNRTLNFYNLSKAVNEDGKRIYSEKLLQRIKVGDFNSLNEISIADRNNKYFMEPLLYAVKNSEFSTYEVFKYYGEELQKNDLSIATEIVLKEPEVLEDTAITDNSAIVLHLAKINPEIILYISDELKNDGEFIENLCETGNREAIAYALDESNIKEVLQDNPNLANNKEFMREAVKEDVTVLAIVAPELKNSYEFIREVSMENRKVIDYVVENTEEFGKEALDGAKDSLQEQFIADASQDVQKEREKIQEEKEQLIAEGKNDEEIAKVFAKRERDLDSIENTMKKFETYSVEEAGKRAKTYLRFVKNIPEEYTKKLESYVKLYEASKEREEKNNTKIEPKNIEALTEDAKLSEVQVEPTAIREEITSQKEQTKENEKEIGE